MDAPPTETTFPFFRMGTVSPLSILIDDIPATSDDIFRPCATWCFRMSWSFDLLVAFNKDYSVPFGS